MKVMVRVPGTCGEWVQSLNPETGKECLVSAPINLYNTVSVFYGDPEVAQMSQAHLMSKSKLAFDLVCRHLKLEVGIRNSIVICRGHSALSIGKGMASSTADIAGIMQAVAILRGSRLSDEALFKLCCTVEASDGVMLSGLQMVDHLSGIVLEKYDFMPQATILMLSPNAVFDTEKLRKGAQYRELLSTKSSLPLERFRQAMKAQDLSRLGEAASLSLIENEAILPKRHLQTLLAIAQSHDCHGVLGGHSGTVTGFILNKVTDLESLKFTLDKSELSLYYNEMTVVESIGGGLTYELTEA